MRQLVSAQRAIVTRLHKQVRPLPPTQPPTEAASEPRAPAQAQLAPPPPRPAESAAPRPPRPIAEAWDIAPPPTTR
jgi:hypothetical protein